jgi:hypothetical protein
VVSGATGRAPWVAVLGAGCLAGCGLSVPAGGGDGLVPACISRADGVITADELPTAPGLAIRFAANAPGTQWPSLPGPADGVALDLSDGPEDLGATLPIVDPGETWWGPRFPGATYGTPTTVALPDLLGVYRVADDGVDLLGYVTATEVEPAQETELHYDEPVRVLQLPLSPGASWGQQATFRDARIAGIVEQGVEDWEFSVGEPTSARLPDGTEVRDVLPITGRLVQNFALSTLDPDHTTWSRSWLAPCFGEIGSVQAGSESLEPADVFRRYFP